MQTVPAWFKVVSVVALLWNLLGCAAFAADMMVSPAAIAAMPPEHQALYARPMWSVAATGVAVFAGALGCVGLLLRRRWALGLFVVSLLAIVLQDIGLFVIVDGARLAGMTVVVLQALVLLVAIALVVVARRAAARGWLV